MANDDGLTPQAHANRTEIALIRAKLLRGVLTYDEAQKLAEPCIERMNKRGAEIAKEFGQRFKPLTFRYLMR